MKIIYGLYVILFLSIVYFIRKEWKTNSFNKKLLRFFFFIFICILLNRLMYLESRIEFLKIYESDAVVIATNNGRVESTIEELFNDDYGSISNKMNIFTRIHYFMIKPDIKISFFKNSKEINSFDVFKKSLNDNLKIKDHYLVKKGSYYVYFGDDFYIKLDELLDGM